ncbi:hypothetical protein H0486_11675 [Lachnospiraceae bacterium MD1]|uniref:Uncharacterized protein n=1 Tax=Variimorphobacter saccharofermentans TaxID=2755051 RepID=A0A839K0T6_9FIRM|nr:hypothetical protein [Variimorphobacter saccharofermentans]
MYFSPDYSFALVNIIGT